MQHGTNIGDAQYNLKTRGTVLEDNQKFLEVLNDCKAVCGYKLFAYCLMGNHIHLLIKVEKEDLEQIFKQIGGRYVYWYNGKYSRVGHLFQDRYKSESVETDEHFLAVLRYIHQNPVNAGLSKTVGDYIWSSYNEYINPKEDPLTDSEFALEMIGKDEFVKFNNQINDDKCLEMEDIKFRLTDEQAKKVMVKISKCKNANEFQVLDIEKRDKRFGREDKLVNTYWMLVLDEIPKDYSITVFGDNIPIETE